MKPIKIKQTNFTYAQDQKEYIPLPVHKAKDGVVTSCWGFSFIERLQVLFIGRIYFQTMTFNQSLQPQLPSIQNPVNET